MANLWHTCKIFKWHTQSSFFIIQAMDVGIFKYKKRIIKLVYIQEKLNRTNIFCLTRGYRKVCHHPWPVEKNYKSYSIQRMRKMNILNINFLEKYSVSDYLIKNKSCYLKIRSYWMMIIRKSHYKRDDKNKKQ